MHEIFVLRADVAQVLKANKIVVCADVGKSSALLQPLVTLENMLI